MDYNLLKILSEFSDALHTYEGTGGQVPDNIDNIWLEVTSIIENEKVIYEKTKKPL
jgi:hypothetical protein